MKIVLLITVIESAIVAVLLIMWRFRSMTKPAVLPARLAGQSPKPVTGDATRNDHWRFINSWRVEPQFNDRMQALGAAHSGSETESVRRSTARRRHQAMYKQWSRERHD